MILNNNLQQRIIIRTLLMWCLTTIANPHHRPPSLSSRPQNLVSQRSEPDHQHIAQISQCLLVFITILVSLLKCREFVLSLSSLCTHALPRDEVRGALSSRTRFSFQPFCKPETVRFYVHKYTFMKQLIIILLL